MRFAGTPVAGDFLTCCGEDLGPRGEKAACAAEKGVDTGGVAAAPACDCEGVLPCWESACFMALAAVLGVAIAVARQLRQLGTCPERWREIVPHPENQWRLIHRFHMLTWWCPKFRSAPPKCNHHFLAHLIRRLSDVSSPPAGYGPVILPEVGARTNTPCQVNSLA